MKRDISRLAAREFDLVIIGGGFFAACAAWDATLRGLSVALVERHDFGGATSANSFKMVHGGIRYLQHADAYRVRQSARERRALLRMAPHLVRPLSIAIPTYGLGARGKPALRLGTALYDALTFDRNRGQDDPARRIPICRSLSREETLRMFPDLKPAGLSGSVLFTDAQIQNPPRLVWSVLRSAMEQGAAAANYVKAIGFLSGHGSGGPGSRGHGSGGRIRGILAEDQLNGEQFEVRGRVTLNAAGPYAERLLLETLRLPLEPQGTYSRDAAFIVNRPLLQGDVALAILGATKDPDAVISRGKRHLFIVPWKGRTQVGVWHIPYTGDPDRFTVRNEEVRAWAAEVKAGYPGADIREEDLACWCAGLVPFGRNEDGAEDLRYGHRSRLIDHARTHGLEGLVTLIGVRLTTGRFEAAAALDLVLRKLGRPAPPCRTETLPVYGGAIESTGALAREAEEQAPAGVDPEIPRAWAGNYGAAYIEVLEKARRDPSLWGALPGSRVAGAEVLLAVEEELAVKLSDVVLRRTDLGTGGFPGEGALRACARLMAGPSKWSEQRIESEIAEVIASYPGPTTGPAAAPVAAPAASQGTRG